MKMHPGNRMVILEHTPKFSREKPWSVAEFRNLFELHVPALDRTLKVNEAWADPDGVELIEIMARCVELGISIIVRDGRRP